MMIKFLFLTIFLFGCSFSSKKKLGKFENQTVREPSFSKGSFWGKRLVALTYAPGVNLDSTAMGKSCGKEKGQKGIDECLSLGADINFQTREGMTPLLGAIKREDLSMVKKILGSGVQINLADNQGLTPLMHASRIGNLDLVKVLVESGASMSPSTFGEFRGLRALDIAEFFLNKKVANFLRLKMDWPLVD